MLLGQPPPALFSYGGSAGRFAAGPDGETVRGGEGATSDLKDRQLPVLAAVVGGGGGGGVGEAAALPRGRC